MQTLNIGIIGVGVVGSAVIRILEQNKELICARCGVNFIIKKGVTRNIEKSKKALNGIHIPLENDIDCVLNDESIDVVIELMGGVELAYQVAQRALTQKKAFITANKAMLAYHRASLKQVAKSTPIGFEASVGGGIPIIRALKDGLCANEILAIRGILNGTSNYILTQMFEENKNFQDALKEAQNLGYAEADPTLDINGMDAGHKLLILASLAFGIDALPQNIIIEGIEGITSDDMDFAKEFGYVIKLLGIAKRDKQALELRVHPTLIRKDSMISKVGGVMNGISVVGDCVGESMYYGAGAGGEATASSVIADLMEIARNWRGKQESCADILPQSKNTKSTITLKKPNEILSRYYIRLYTQDKPGVLSKTTQILGQNNISIKVFLQKQGDEVGVAKLLFSTHTSKESDINNALKALEDLDSILQKPYKIRME